MILRTTIVVKAGWIAYFWPERVEIREIKGLIYGTVINAVEMTTSVNGKDCVDVHVSLEFSGHSTVKGVWFSNLRASDVKTFTVALVDDDQ